MPGLIGKFLEGVSQVAVPAALEEHKARIQAKRDKALFENEKALQAEQIGAQKDIAATREAGATARHAETMGFNTTQAELTAEYRQAALAAQETARQDRLDWEKIQVDLESENKALQKKLLGLQITEQEGKAEIQSEVRQLYTMFGEIEEQYSDPKDAPKRKALQDVVLRRINMLKGDKGHKSTWLMDANGNLISGDPDGTTMQIWSAEHIESIAAKDALMREFDLNTPEGIMAAIRAKAVGPREGRRMMGELGFRINARTGKLEPIPGFSGG